MILSKKEKISKLCADLLSGKEHLSFSSFNAFLKSPAHFIEYKFGEKVEKAEFNLGKLAHTILLEPQFIETRYLIFDREKVLPFPKKNYQTKANREARDLFIENAPANVEVVEKQDFKDVEELVDSIRKVSAAKGILDMCTMLEQALVFKYGGFTWKGFKDAGCEELTTDIKTAKDASKRGFKRSIRQYGYHRQSFLYNTADGQKHKPYFIIAVEKTKPYAVGLHRITPQLLDRAQQEIDKGLIEFRRCLLDEPLFLQSYEFWAKKSHGIFDVDLTYF